MEHSIEIIESPHTGYCFGVKRAMSLLKEGMHDRIDGKIYTLGEIIHNPQAIERLSQSGVNAANNLSEVEEGGTVVIRAHGVHPDVLKEAEKKNINVIDTTCPFVQRSQTYVKMLSEEGRDVIIIGDRRHPEVKGISGHVKNNSLVINSLEETSLASGLSKAGVVTQTTFSHKKSGQIIEKLMTMIEDLKVYDTICRATIKRRKATMDIASQVDMILVVGGKGSSNTNRLHIMCVENGIYSRLIETADEIKSEWFDSIKKVGLTTGTSTPDWVIQEVKEKLLDISKDC